MRPKRMPMRTTKLGIQRAFLATVAASLIMTAGGCAQPATETEQAGTEAAADPSLIRLDEQQIRIADITLGEVAVRLLEESLQVSGRVTLNENLTARAGAFTEGMVVTCCEPVGADVKEGQVLARIHSHEIHDAEASYRQAVAEVQQRRAELRFAEEFHSRASRLHELKAGSLQEVQQAATSFRSAEMVVEIARAGLVKAEHHLRFLGISPEQLSGEPVGGTAGGQGTHEETHLIDVRSPASGTIIERAISSGAVVTPSDSLYVISDLSTLWVIAQVPEQHLSSLRTGMAVDVGVRAYPGKTFPARITYIGDALDPETRTVEVRCELNNPGRQLKTEMFATVSISASGGTDALVVPLAALQTVDGQEVVFVPESEHSFRARRVQIGRHFDAAVEIVGGLQEGEKVVVGGAFHLKSELLNAQMSEE